MEQLTPQAAFKAQQYPPSIQAYSRSADMALSRPPWELAALSRDETTVALCNRSAAFAAMGQWYVHVDNPADAQARCFCRRRRRRPVETTLGQGTLSVRLYLLSLVGAVADEQSKAKALEGMGRLEEARDAIEEGLQFEPDNQASSDQLEPRDADQQELNEVMAELSKRAVAAAA